jgi:LemA protein
MTQSSPNPASQIPENLVPQVLEQAGKLYQQQNPEGYSLADLMAAGAEAQIPPELIRQAYAEIQQQQQQVALQQQAAKLQWQRAKQRSLIAGSVFALLSLAWLGLTYNNLNGERAVVAGKWAQVENQMQRRADLIPQLVTIAESFADREERVLQKKLTQAREGFLTAQSVAEQQAADEVMKGAISQFQSFAANSEQLQSSELFINLQYEIAGTENRIATERMRYNQAVQGYNESLTSFPAVLVARPLGFNAGEFGGGQ